MEVLCVLYMSQQVTIGCYLLLTIYINIKVRRLTQVSEQEEKGSDQEGHRK